MKLRQFFPILDWGKNYTKDTLTDDGLAAIIVTIMLIPQSLAYALLAGLPPQVGLYASIAPLFAYMVFGTSRTLAVGPVAVVSLMTAAAIGNIAATGTQDYLIAALTLAFLSGLFLILMGVFRLGFFANFLSHPVISGFITASGIIIAASQLGTILGVKANGHNLLGIVQSLVANITTINLPTALIGGLALAFLFWVRKGLKPLLMQFGLAQRPAEMISKAGPIFAVLATTLAVSVFSLDTKGVAIVGIIPTGMPPLTLPNFDLSLWSTLISSAFLISLIGFVESVSVAQTLAAKRRERIDPNQELIGLGTANIASGLTGGYPVTGGFARSVVNFDAGAKTPAAGGFTAIGILIAALFLTPLIHNLPKATLAATIIVAVLSLVNIKSIIQTWTYSKSDFAAMAATILGTLVIGVEIGVMIGVGLSICLLLYRTSRPHCAIVGQVSGTEHFRNINRHKVNTSPAIISLRMDESLYFANARFLEDKIYSLVAENPAIKHVILMCPAINDIDASGLESLEAINLRLKDGGVAFHLSEVKGPVMDRLTHTHFLQELTGQVYLSQYEAMCALDPNACIK